ncbi:MAG: hypothetical protein U0Y08_10055 [Bacteroidia bacterium]
MKIYPILVAGTFLMMIAGTLQAQETPKPCDAKFEVDAGPDIDVCQGGTVGLSGLLGGDATHGVWRGGKGTFSPDRNTALTDYTPDSSEYGTTVMLTFVGDNPKFPDCPKGRDDIQIRINLQPKVNAGSNAKGCAGHPVKLNGKLLEGNAKKLVWSSNGAGTFDDPSKPDAVFTPHEVDGAKGSVILTFKAIPFGVCLPDSDMIELKVLPAPMVKLPAEMKSTGLAPVTIDAKVTGDGRLTWSSSGTGKFSTASKANTVYTPSEEDLAAGKVVIRLRAEGQKGCDSKAEMVLLLKK